MAIRVALHHVTRYTYDRKVELGPHLVRLRPAPHTRTPISAYSLRVTPEPHFLNWQQDPFGNWQARLVWPKPITDALEVSVDLIADLTAINPFDFFVEPYAEKLPFEYEDSLARELRPYLECVETGPRFALLVGRIFDDIARPGRTTLDVLIDINQLIQKSLKYDIRMEPGVFAPEETLERGHGSCRDFAWLLVNVMRHMGLAARFVSGYSIQIKADQKPVTGAAGVEFDCTDLHAWAEVYLPGAGFIGFDATSGLACGEGHIPLACSAEPSSAAPVSGAFGWEKEGEDDDVQEKLAFSMSVTRVEDRPRPTKPYTDAQWQSLLTCGEYVDERLNAGDVRLSMGGEPTFVAVDDPDGEEWNTTALGPTKPLYADKLIRRLQTRFAPGSMLHHGQGKWYPGEPLPRWAYSCYFRLDGEPIWRNPALIASTDAACGHDSSTAQRLISALAQRLGLESDYAIPAYEDVFYYLWRERRLPINVDPFDARLEDEQERERLRRVFDQGLRAVVGYTLPLRSIGVDDQRTWESGRWFLREERMYLIPGDSPMGYRLPLDSLPWLAPEDRELHFDRDAMEPLPQLPPHAQLAKRKGDKLPVQSNNASDAEDSDHPSADTVRTALCVEPRDGILHVFMPPLTELEPYLELVAALEAVVEELGLVIQIEGYHPPSDTRMQRIQATPDPGVLEVNLHPAYNFEQLKDNTLVLYEEAKECGLATEKFLHDGQHAGTGGGNHLTLGGATPADSPWLRRPDLLRSLTAYVLNHPSLSYLFSSLFVGPTSQAPRLDEARHDALYELEIAYGILNGHEDACPPWLVDRVFRHLLVDVTGNTHRTEMSIDKLFSPDGPAGRQGLLELRAFEMPPDAKMSVAAQLLIRALIARFWETPYRERIIRWGTRLIDRFMLPHFILQDIKDIVSDLNGAGFAFDLAWFEPQYEFRFPIIGRVAIEGMEVELRKAIEPWHVLGEQPGGAGTVRYVDSSVERLQVLVRNMVESRYVLCCNGQRVPLHPTGVAGEFVAGIRYRAWKPPTALHPTLDVDAPLVLEVHDCWNDRSLGGATYHVSHPGGRAYDVAPRNALEAESRRASRFFPFGHRPGRHVAPPLLRNPDLPLTLDLRRPSDLV